MDIAPPQKIKSREIVERTVEAALGSVPLAGPALAVTFVTALGWRLEQRWEEWFTQLAEGLEDVQHRIGDLNFETLADDPVFVDAVVTTTRMTEHTHQKEKLAALRHAVLNSVAPEAPDADTRAMFLNLVDRFTPTHLRLLTMLNDPPGLVCIAWPDPPAKAVAGAMVEFMKAGLPELIGRQEFYGLVAGDLNASGLLAAELSGLLGTAALMRPLTNAIGRQFVESRLATERKAK